MNLNLNFYPKSDENSQKLPKAELLDFNHELSLFRTHQKEHFLKELITSQNLIKKFKINENQIQDKAIQSPKEEEREFKLIEKMKDVGPNPEFQLLLHAGIEDCICKGKYFSFKVILGEISGFLYPVKEILQLEVVVYDNDEYVISKNMKGQEILRGNYRQNMHFFKPESKHVAYFRVQITEVSSHYMNKTLNLLVRAKETDFLSKTGWQVKPILIENIKVRAKKSY